ncbi:unnamed protein product [Phyllotreta striolata]|uniref:Uncharacterized protein n=1 Tax=Phyllotreta striolata TaxID=444603 RepID=A0A9P0E0M3_PHYSR|nr:unnamed protein product [Phyllotreta striolata]
MGVENRNKIVIAASEGFDRTMCRKILECIFRKTNVDIEWRIPGKAQTTNSGGEGSGKQKRTNNVLTLKSNGSTYAELLKKVKENIDINKLGVNIKKIRSIGEEEVQLVLEEGNGKAKSFMEEVATKCNDVSVSIRTYGQIIYITGIEVTATEEDIKTAITNVVEIGEEDIQIKSIKEGKYKEKTAVVQLPKQAAKTLVREGTIKIGWSDNKPTETNSVTTEMEHEDATGKDEEHIKDNEQQQQRQEQKQQEHQQQQQQEQKQQEHQQPQQEHQQQQHQQQ